METQLLPAVPISCILLLVIQAEGKRPARTVFCHPSSLRFSPPALVDKLPTPFEVKCVPLFFCFFFSFFPPLACHINAKVFFVSLYPLLSLPVSLEGTPLPV